MVEVDENGTDIPGHEPEARIIEAFLDGWLGSHKRVSNRLTSTCPQRASQLSPPHSLPGYRTSLRTRRAKATARRASARETGS